ncbi:hypothetical protein MG290_03020 [Flavobacterium sp. CBA20B-1]|uniref:hypothetical protein n=1 Tax=unclassified Flavobacterium TaxID=196869 RepID=UPI0022254F47|nr:MULTISPECIES: hypothetical protein [unclassified Flavobacterium]WCM42664.1 hypothetical protein MG290_03020 [Flavobacterium sp. CBA20B-1]
MVVSCTHKGEPTKQGEMLTTEQINALANDQSMNGELVSVEGFASFCGSFSSVTGGKKGRMTIYSDGFCKGGKLMDAEILFADNKTPLSGEEERNQAIVDKNFSNETIKFTTDDYQEVSNGKLRFSGTVVYDGNNFYLDNVTIHK